MTQSICTYCVDQNDVTYICIPRYRPADVNFCAMQCLRQSFQVRTQGKGSIFPPYRREFKSINYTQIGLTQVIIYILTVCSGNTVKY